ncbi:MAG: class I SAM-dependent methyltransferase [Euryarchaeota archaeon]|nr:class I SAM-dependent methyltransferase [Euryarchaeota archaeon]
MKVEWNTDERTAAMVWGAMARPALESTKGLQPGWLLDLGGSGGSYGEVFKDSQPALQIVSIDLVPGKPVPGAHVIKGDVRCLPVKTGSLRIVSARAILHHVPEELGVVCDEVFRALPRGGFFVVLEPCEGNPVARLARGFLTTTEHEEGERPLTMEAMVSAMRRKFDVRDVQPFFLFSYLAPHVVARLPGALKGIARLKVRILAAFDEAMLRAFPMARKWAAYVHICGVKK